jgi:hypothetical protein
MAHFEVETTLAETEPILIGVIARGGGKLRLG